MPKRCIQVEWDPSYYGGDYASVGQFAYVPHESIDRIAALPVAAKDDEIGLRLAFAALVADPVHIVHYTWDEAYDEDGNPWPDDDEAGGYSVTLTQDFAECERGNILLQHTEEFWLNAYIEVERVPTLPGAIYLEITWRPENYPALGVSLVRIRDDKLWAHLINEFWNGLWTIRKLNLTGHTPEELEACWKTKEEEEAHA